MLNSSDQVERRSITTILGRYVKKGFDMSPDEDDSISEGRINLSGDLLAGKVTTDAPPPEVVSKFVDDHGIVSVHASLWEKMRALLKSWRQKIETMKK